MDIKIRKMELKDWKYVSKIYIEGINTGNGILKLIYPHGTDGV